MSPNKFNQPKKRSNWNFLIYCLILITFIFSLVHYGLYLEDHETELESFYLNNGSEEFGYKRTVMGAYAGEFEKGFENGFYMIHNTQKIPVFYLDGYSFVDSPSRYVQPSYGEVAVYGYVTDKAIYALSINNHDYNYILYFVSFFAGLFVLALFFREWKITWRGFKSA